MTSYAIHCAFSWLHNPTSLSVAVCEFKYYSRTILMYRKSVIQSDLLTFLSSSVSIVTRLWAVLPGFDSRQG